MVIINIRLLKVRIQMIPGSIFGTWIQNSPIYQEAVDQIAVIGNLSFPGNQLEKSPTLNFSYIN